ncbi:M56 family metallopeptidase [Undibacterium sp. LX40W]|uniref:M56 family metallopeptidase n=1 Tax=Undibacterium nitidum TaxID=2762298 RepID=A0A923HT42_9BURK|nr:MULTISPECIES: M56 family metallopeptidase [Undibacterium]MBC3880674.1 M56 family metallopeptidase [Undibacterium nitidum]MBC3890591.1 M56 family metallopeptidase [Undibacterium sp. LX40W]
MATSSLELNAVVFALGWTMIQSMWQSSVVALSTHSILQMFGITNANVRCKLFCFAMVVCTGWSLATFLGLYDSQVAIGAKEPSSTSVYQVFTSISEFDRFDSYNSLCLLVLFWLIGCIVLSFKLMFDVLTTHRLKHQNTTILNEDWQIKLAQLKHQIGVRKDVAMRLSQSISVPCVIGYVKPVILIPTSLFLGLNPQQVEMIVLHELAHVRRHDVLIGFVQVLVRIVFFFSPAVHHLSNRIDQEREHACDDLAIQACGDALSYARTLQTCAEMHLVISPRFAFVNHYFGRNSMLKQRILRLFVGNATHPVNIRNLTGGVITLVTSMIIAGCSLMFVNEPDLNVEGKGVRFEISIKKNGELLAQPKLVSTFGQAASFELEKQIKIVSVAQKPKGQRSHVESSIYQFDGDKWVLVWSPSMDAVITQTPSFEFTSQDDQYRIVIKPRLADLPSTTPVVSNQTTAKSTATY